jgi:hypothetical protein
MRTFSRYFADGTLDRFEFNRNLLTNKSVMRVLASVEGVSNVERNWGNWWPAIEFRYRGAPCVVYLTYRRSDHYVVTESDGLSVAAPRKPTVDLGPIRTAFDREPPEWWIVGAGIVAVVVTLVAAVALKLWLET